MLSAEIACYTVVRTVNSDLVLQVTFAINCDNLEDCTSDLKLTVELYLESGGRRGQKVEKDTILYLGASEKLQMQVDVTNLQSSSYGSKFTSLSDVALEGDITLSE